MNFSPQVRAWLLLFTLIISSGGAVGMTTFLGGANWKVALITGAITGVTNLYHALAASPKEKAEAAASSRAPFSGQVQSPPPP